MIELGVDPTRLKAVSRAEFAPVASNETAEGRAKNRRIEIQLDAPIDDSDETSGAENPPAESGPTTPTPPEPDDSPAS
jgi:hypothetical protein